MKRFTNTAEMIFTECSAIQRMNSTTSTVPIPLTTAPSATVCEFLVGDRNRSGQPDPCAIFTHQVEIAGGLSDGVRCVLSGLQRVEIEDRFELDEGAAIGRRSKACR